MKHGVVGLVCAFALSACGSKPAPAPASPEPTPSATASATPPASSPAPAIASAPAPAPAPAPVPEVTTSVTAVSNEISTPAVLSPDKVIATLRPKFNACFADGLKKDPKTGSVTLSAKIDKDGKVSTVTPKMLTGFSPTVVKCLSDRLKAANFAASGGMNYTTSLDIPLSFTANQ